jgi:hypothetical protein
MSEDTAFLQHIPVPVVVVAVLLALVAAVLLWKLLATAAVIGLVQWAVITHTTDGAAHVIAYAAPALLAAVVLVRLSPFGPLFPAHPSPALGRTLATRTTQDRTARVQQGVQR